VFWDVFKFGLVKIGVGWYVVFLGGGLVEVLGGCCVMVWDVGLFYWIGCGVVGKWLEGSFCLGLGFVFCGGFISVCDILLWGEGCFSVS
jgi:hypothetical protein